ncbi:Cyclic GMP-AMP synthase-like receptor [Anthophora plagiata]
MENSKLKKYLSNDEVFKAINKHFITLKDEEVEKINVYLLQVIETLMERMKMKDSLFKKTYSKIIFCGSFYKGTKVEKPNEFDLNIILNLPMKYSYVNFYSTLPSFVKINVDHPLIYSTQQYENLTMDEKRSFEKLISHGNLNPNKFRHWIEGVIDKVIYELPKPNKLLIERGFNSYEVKIKVKKSGPAFTIILNLPCNTEEIHIDLAPALVFNTFMIEEYTTRFDELKNCRNKEWFAIPVPVTNTNCYGIDDHWRLSFCLQENEILRKCGSVKPVIRQMKKLRNVQNWKCIASYYIETLFLHKYKELDDLHTIPLTLLFFTMLKELYHACEQHEIKYFWNKNYNLLGKISKIEMSNITYRLNNIIKHIQKDIMKDSFVLAKYILYPYELQVLQEKFNSTTENENEENENNIAVYLDFASQLIDLLKIIFR